MWQQSIKLPRNEKCNQFHLQGIDENPSQNNRKHAFFGGLVIIIDVPESGHTVELSSLKLGLHSLQHRKLHFQIAMIFDRPSLHRDIVNTDEDCFDDEF